MLLALCYDNVFARKYAQFRIIHALQHSINIRTVEVDPTNIHCIMNSETKKFSCCDDFLRRYVWKLLENIFY